MKYLIDYGVRANVFDSCGFSPLHTAAKHGYVDIIDLLLRAGSNADSFCSNAINPVNPEVMLNPVK